MSRHLDRDHLSELWQRQWPLGPPLAHELRVAYSDRCVRFHSLPGSKRHPETEDEYAVVLDRSNTVLEELFAGTDIYVLTMAWSSEPTGPELPTRRREVHPDGSFRMTIANEADPEFHTYTHLYADRRPWQRGSVDGILREVADNVPSRLPRHVCRTPPATVHRSGLPASAAVGVSRR
ncbi:hypothetical protein NCG97_14120 [Streptomyces lydicamycinicus]|uniref:DUF3885 domain-containing protein n=1 Tax=Streptomyces lydicamycinicus TaxID=1546107 RepID=UPI002035257B|nr:hypothetical protein [Streptomyces lydicamycinicus]USA01562.1 hypothetical protein NCG97_14120 [Streptomyces lydicamycinicus]